MHHGLIAWLIIGGFLARTMHIAVGSGVIASLIVASIGACVLVFLIRTVKRAA